MVMFVILRIKLLPSRKIISKFAHQCVILIKYMANIHELVVRPEFNDKYLRGDIPTKKTPSGTSFRFYNLELPSFHIYLRKFIREMEIWFEEGQV